MVTSCDREYTNVDLYTTRWERGLDIYSTNISKCSRTRSISVSCSTEFYFFYLRECSIDYPRVEVFVKWTFLVSIAVDDTVVHAVLLQIQMYCIHALGPFFSAYLPFVKIQVQLLIDLICFAFCSFAVYFYIREIVVYLSVMQCYMITFFRMHFKKFLPLFKGDEEDEMKYIPVNFIEKPFYDDHFDLPTDKLRLGKTLVMVTRGHNDLMANSYRLLGWAHYEKFEKGLAFLRDVVDQDEKNSLAQEAVCIIFIYIF